MQNAVQKNRDDLEALAAAGVDVTLTTRETMLALGIGSPSTLWRWVRAGKVPPPSSSPRAVIATGSVPVRLQNFKQGENKIGRGSAR